MRHERKQAELSDLRAAVLRLHSDVVADLRIPRNGQDRYEGRQTLGYHLLAQLPTVAALAASVSRDFFKQLTDIHSRLMTAATRTQIDPDVLTSALNELDVVLMTWLMGKAGKGVVIVEHHF